MTKADLWKEDIITITIVLSLVFYDYIQKEWKEFKSGWPETIVLGHYELLFFTPMPQNKFATEPQVEVVDQPYFENAERVNGQLAMLGFVAAIGSYLTTGQIIPGIF